MSQSRCLCPGAQCDSLCGCGMSEQSQRRTLACRAGSLLVGVGAHTAFIFVACVTWAHKDNPCYQISPSELFLHRPEGECPSPSPVPSSQCALSVQLCFAPHLWGFVWVLPGSSGSSWAELSPLFSGDFCRVGRSFRAERFISPIKKPNLYPFVYLYSWASLNKTVINFKNGSWSKYYFSPCFPWDVVGHSCAYGLTQLLLPASLLV